jgi:GNAT superfamily N-acetyltransferase
MEQEPLTFRIAGRSDLPVLLRLYAQLGRDERDVLDLAEAEALFARLEAYPDYRVHLAESGGAAVGTWSLLVMDNLAHRGLPSGIVENVVVDSSCRGRGVGRAMMRRAMEIARGKGCYKLALTSGRHRPDAHRFYESLGFERHGFSFHTELEAPRA